METFLHVCPIISKQNTEYLKLEIELKNVNIYFKIVNF